jgi:hypothetical protein
MVGEEDGNGYIIFIDSFVERENYSIVYRYSVGIELT